MVSRIRACRSWYPGVLDERVSVWGVDDAGWGRLAIGISLAAGGSRMVWATDLERGRGMIRGLGDGVGKWRLDAHARWPVSASGLMASPGGHLTNLSTAPAASVDGMWRAPLFPAAGGASGRQGFARVANLSGLTGEVLISGVDDGGNRAGPPTLAMDGRRRCI